MSFSKDLSDVLPRSDPTEGADNGDKLRVVVSRRVKKYMTDILKDGLNAKMIARIVKAKGAWKRDRHDLSRPPTLNELRSRKGKHIRMAFLERETKSRVRTKLVIGGIDKGWTIHRALFAAGIRKERTTTTDKRVAAKLAKRGYRKYAANEYELQITRKL
jgi:hypothetical protein